ncbi:MAG TPA: flagellar hook-basal body complex protein FliE [Bdellovibrionota bacterium]|jgi:flagellar hook-basal body complex protein FliE|nr:flagellar hook-basal body complex protein FliE [Bdellovibrionota bacterium]
MNGMASIEGLNQVIRTDPDLAGSVGGGGSVGSESVARREMERHGLQAHEAPAAGKGFMDMLSGSLQEVNTQQLQADQAIRELVAGRTKNIHETMLAVERADASLKLMMQVRNKILDAYREVMRMQV